ncbi:MAG TPA: TonB family protein [Candidatus Didemnitutus sp.]|nr:TonB family protein [Candidatus Didemnitutus sp.]
MKLSSTLLASSLLLLAGTARICAAPSGEEIGIGIDQTVPAAYPTDMQAHGISTGEVRVIISVDAQGVLTDCLVVAYTQESFAREVKSVVKRWKYEPALVHGNARAASTNLIFKFSSDLTTIVEGLGYGVEAHIMPELKNRYEYSACQLRDLDHIPTPVHVVQPQLPGLPDTLRTVSVEFYIDEQGKVRAATIGREYADDIYAAAAVEAVEKWQFEPPMRRGKAVLVAAKQDFRFLPKK